MVKQIENGQQITGKVAQVLEAARKVGIRVFLTPLSGATACEKGEAIVVLFSASFLAHIPAAIHRNRLPAHVAVRRQH
jgi:hypothetical protein